MLILLDDKVQSSNAPRQLKSPALSDTYTTLTSFDITLDGEYPVNCIGFGHTDATSITITNIAGLSETITPAGNGLYELPQTTADVFHIEHNGTYIGRVALGLSRSLGAAPTREAGFYTTQANRITLSGQVIPGAGGYNGRRIALDFRYKIPESVWDDIEASYPYIARGYPWFIKFTESEQLRLPFARIYASPNDPNMLLQSSVRRFLYSKQLDLYERF